MSIFNLPRLKMTRTSLIICSSVLLLIFYNVSYYQNIVRVYPLSLEQLPFLASLVIIQFLLFNLAFAALCHRYTIKPVLIAAVVISALSAYFMDSYNIVIDNEMVRNAISTDVGESMDLLSFKMFLYVLLLGIVPAVFIFRIDIADASLEKELQADAKFLIVAIPIIILLSFSFNKDYFSFLREHKILRYYSNPGGPIYGAVKYARGQFATNNHEVTTVGRDAKTPNADSDRELIIFVVGETARADHFSLNGYERKTNPLLEKEDIINFSNMFSCGTSTAVSVPCMFSALDQKNFSYKKAEAQENLLDVLVYAGVNVLWRDNNSSSKGVALRVTQEDYRDPSVNPICDIECRDEGMLSNLQDYIDKQEEGDVFIVLHQMGNHGPAYYKRYPQSFEKFTPTCKTNQLEDCSREEIINAYDNAVLYTDHFLKKTIDLLKNNSPKFETAMFYMSDHGESLGENGLYLHGLPPFFAPKEQTHVASVLWFSENYGIDKEKINANERLSHDNVFHTVLSMMEITSTEYNEDLDILRAARTE